MDLDVYDVKVILKSLTVCPSCNSKLWNNSERSLWYNVGCDNRLCKFMITMILFDEFKEESGIEFNGFEYCIGSRNSSYKLIYNSIIELCLEYSGQELAEKINKKMRVWQIFS